MQISQKLQEQQDKADELFMAAEAASRVFLRMAEEEGLSRREVQDRWMHIVDWGSKERNAELWKQQLIYDLEDTEEEIIESMDKREEDLMTYVQPEDEFEHILKVMAAIHAYNKQLIKAYFTAGRREGMSDAELKKAYFDKYGENLESPDGGDVFDENIDEG